MKPMLLAAAVAALAVPALAEDHDDDGDDIRTLAAAGTVDEAFSRLEAAVTGAGATVFAAVDHAKGAMSIDQELAPAKLLIFGNPALGTPAMQEDIRAGLYLPLKMFVYENADGGTVVAWEDPWETLDDLAVSEDAEWLKKMTGALEKFATAAAGG